MLTLGSQGCFQGGVPGGSAFRIGYMGSDPLHGTVPGKFSTRGCKVDNGETSKDTGGGGTIIPNVGNRNGGVGL